MRLLKAHEAGDRLEVVEFSGAEIPPYAILSHTWGDDEVQYADLGRPRAAKKKKGFKKISFALAQARKDSLEFVWVDTW